MGARFLPYGRQSIDDADVAEVIRVLKGDYLTQGPAVGAFEREIAESTRAPAAIACSNGTAALHIAALALEFKPGDAAIVPAITFAATANAILYTGASPVFCDVDASGGLAVGSAEKALALAKAKGLNVRAIFPVHYAGRPADMLKVWDFAASNGLKVVEDACHAVGAQYKDAAGGDYVPVGGSSRSSFACWSYHPVKHLTTGEGGSLTAHDPALAKRAEALRTHGITKDAGAFVNKDRAFDPATGAVNSWYMEMQDLGFNYRLCDVQAALGTSQFKKVPRFVERRREIARYYDSELKGTPNLVTPAGDDVHRRHSYHLYPVRVDFAQAGTTRGRFMERLKEQGIGSQVHYVPVHWHPYYERNRNRWLAVETPEAERFYAQELSIPMYPDLTDADLKRVVVAIRSSLGG